MEGTVVDSDDENPLVGANVLVKGMAVGTVTNKQISPGDFTTEKVSTYEVCYRGVINENLLIDAYYYFSAYTDFGAQINTVQSAGPDNDLQGDGVPPFAGEANPVGIVQNNINVQNFLTTINADGVVASHGFAVGVD